MGDTIESLVVHGKLPRRSSADLKLLDFDTDSGITAIAEVLRGKPLAGVDYRSLSRYATKVALTRMSALPALSELQTVYRQYLDARKDWEQSERLLVDESLWGLACGYKPFVHSRVHIWFWDEDVKNAIFAVLLDSGLPKQFVYPFVADALSELPNISKMGEDLVMEHRRAMRWLSGFLGAVKGYLT